MGIGQPRHRGGVRDLLELFAAAARAPGVDPAVRAVLLDFARAVLEPADPVPNDRVRTMTFRERRPERRPRRGS